MRTMREQPEQVMQYDLLTASNDCLYFRARYEVEIENYIMKIPKNPPRDIDVEPELFIEHEEHMWAIAVNYKLGGLTQGTQNRKALKSCDSKDCHSGEGCDDSDCDNCFEDDCGVSDEEPPKRRYVILII